MSSCHGENDWHFSTTTESIWWIVYLLAELITLIYLVAACALQYWRGSRRDAVILGIGIFWFVGALLLEYLAEAGVVPLFYWGEFGFLGLAVAASLQLANQVIGTEEGLTAQQSALESLVEERTVDLQEANKQLVKQDT